MGERYKNKNIVWILGGDRKLDTSQHCDIIEAMAKGLRVGDGGAHLISFHPVSIIHILNTFGDRDWLDFVMFQSGHCRKTLDNYKLIEVAYLYPVTRPAMDAESCYELMPRWDFNWCNIVVWFMYGGIRDELQLFKDLNNRVEDHDDNGQILEKE